MKTLRDAQRADIDEQFELHAASNDGQTCSGL